MECGAGADHSIPYNLNMFLYYKSILIFILANKYVQIKMFWTYRAGIDISSGVLRSSYSLS